MKVSIAEDQCDTMAPANQPKDAHVMASILRDMGIMDWEPRVINQLLEFAYNYVTAVLDDARMFSNHANKKAIDVEDVRLAVQMFTEKNVTAPPSRTSLLEVARVKNATTLPIPKPTCGLRLPPDRFCLTSCNFKLKSNKKQPPPRAGQPYYINNASAASMAFKGAQPSKPMQVLVNQSSPVASFTMTPQGSLASQMRPMVANPMMKMSSTAPTNKIQIQPAQSGPTMFTMTINPPSGASSSANAMKRKADDMS